MHVYLLAGGRSRRMGKDKARLNFGGRALIEAVAHQLDGHGFLRPQVIGQVEGQYRDLGFMTHADRWPQKGPLGGLATACWLQQNRPSPWFLLGSCDTLNLCREDLNLLLTAPRERRVAVAFRHSQSGRWEGLWALYHSALLPRLEHALQHEDLSLQTILTTLRQEGGVEVCEASACDWWQINTPVDFERAQARFEGQDI